MTTREDNDDLALRAINLFDGYGGFELALRELGVRTVCRVERDSYAASVLVERMEEARLDQAPIWDDVTTFDGSPWRDKVHIITGGFPCQPFSAAGQRRGLADDRWLWPHFARIIGDVRPDFVLLENVPGLINHGLPEVLHDLAALGFDAEWGLLSAAEVGAPHKRERFWLLAHTSGSGLERRSATWQGRYASVAHVGEDVADASSLGSLSGNGPGSDERSRGVSDIQIGSVGLGWPPGRDDDNGWRQWIDAGGPQPVLRRRTDGPPNGLADAIHLGGNGLVPQCARAAFIELARRAVACGTNDC